MHAGLSTFMSRTQAAPSESHKAHVPTSRRSLLCGMESLSAAHACWIRGSSTSRVPAAPSTRGPASRAAAALTCTQVLACRDAFEATYAEHPGKRLPRREHREGAAFVRARACVTRGGAGHAQTLIFA